MYLPRNLPLCRPHIAMWIGESGKQYEFAVVRPGTIAIDEPAVFILAKQEGARTTPLYVGQTSSLHRKFGLSRESCPDEWRRALAMGMTHVHLRFDACSHETRKAEVIDLAAALMPAMELASAGEEGADGSALMDMAARTTVVPFHERQHREVVTGASRTQFPTLVFASTETEDQGAFTNSFASGSLFRADPAREDDGDATYFGTLTGLAPATEHSIDGESSFADDEYKHKPIQPDMAPEPIRHAAADMEEQSDTAKAAESAKSDIRSRLSISELIQRVLDFVARQRTARHARTEIRPSSPGPTFRAERVIAIGAPAESPRFGQIEEDSEVCERDNNRAIRFDIEGQDQGAAAHAVAEPARTGEMLESSEGDGQQDRNERARAGEILESSEGDGQQDRNERERADDATIIDMREIAPLPREQPVAAEAGASLQDEAKRVLDLQPTAPVVLFAGRMCYEAGADILMDAVITVCGGNCEAVFLFAGDGPLEGELRAWAARAGVDRRCRFLGDVKTGAFHTVLAACDFVVIPARVPSGEELARMALANGKPVLVTHQAAVGLIVHGWNGLVTYDNPGSLVWGIRELLGPLCVNLRQHLSEAA